MQFIDPAAGSVLAGLVLAWHDVGAQVPPFDENREIPTLAPLLKQVMPAVVNVAVVGSTTETRNPLLDDPFFRRFFEAPQPDVRPQPHQSVGSGVIVDAEQGLIVTNQHVVRDAERIVVTTSDRRQFDAIGIDEYATIRDITRMYDELPNGWMFEFDACPQLRTHVAAAVPASFLLLDHRYAPRVLRWRQVST